MSDLIDRKKAIEEMTFSGGIDHYGVLYVPFRDVTKHLRELPSVHPELDEWCTECKEYNIANHNCPRFNRVIRETLDEIKHKSKSVIYHGDVYADGCMVYDTAECPSCGYIFDEEDSVWKEPFCPHCGQRLTWKGEADG